MEMPLPQTVDLRSHMPRAFDQMAYGSCGSTSLDAHACFLFPTVNAFSRFQNYYDVRTKYEGADPSDDSGVETRDLFKAWKAIGFAPEIYWPYIDENFDQQPRAQVYNIAESYKITSYSRLGSEQDCLKCLADGFPFVLGFDVPESLDADEVNKTGVLAIPESRKPIGGHDVLIVGYDLAFRSNDVFLRSGIHPDRVSDRAFMVRNSWGTSWSRIMRGHFYVPMSVIEQQFDAWTARR